MSRKPPNQLTARKVLTFKSGKIGDGGGLWLFAEPGARRWQFHYTSPATGKRRAMGLGSAFDINLALARDRARDARLKLAHGIDPLEEKKARKAAEAALISFETVALRYIEEKAPSWRDKKGAATWRASLMQHVFPVFGAKSVATIDIDDVLAALRPIWTTKNETASRLRSRIERILDYAEAHNWREGKNVARWAGSLKAILPAPAEVKTVTHHAAISRADIASVMAALTTSEGIAARAVQFACLTAARSGEVRSAVWSEIDLAAALWVIPAARMKAKREHRIPLCPTAIAVLESVAPLRDPSNGDLVFPGQKQGSPLSDVALSKALHVAAGTKDVTVHGLRSTFRDWMAEDTDYPNEVAELTLAHTIANKVEAAYRRGDMLEKRRLVMDEWGAFAT